MQEKTSARTEFSPDAVADEIGSHIEAEGEVAGLAARDRDGHGYPAGSTEAESWLHGYDRGQKTMRDNLEAALEKNNAAKAEEDKAKLVKAGDVQAEGDDQPDDADPFDEDEDLRPRFKREPQEAPAA